MFGRKKKSDISEHPFRRGYQDAMKQASVLYFGHVSESWMDASIRIQAYLVVDRTGEMRETITVKYESWASEEYVNGVLEYLEALADAVEIEREQRRNRLEVKVEI